MSKFNFGKTKALTFWSSQEREGRIIEKTAAKRPEGYRVGIQKRIEVERHGNC